MIVMDVPYIFDKVGGPMALLNLLRRHNPTVPLYYPTVQMWKARGRISSTWTAATLHALTREGHELGELLIEDEGPCCACAGY